MAQKIINVYLEKKLFLKLDEKRGLVPRSSYVRELIKRDVDNHDRV